MVEQVQFITNDGKTYGKVGEDLYIPQNCIRKPQPDDGMYGDPRSLVEEAQQTQSQWDKTHPNIASPRPAAYGAVTPGMNRNEARVAVQQAKTQYRETGSYNIRQQYPTAPTQPQQQNYVEEPMVGFNYDINGVTKYRVENIVEEKGKIVSFDVVDDAFDPSTSYMNILINKLWGHTSTERIDGTFVDVTISNQTGILLKFSADNGEYNLSTKYNFPKVVYTFTKKSKEIL